MPRQARPRWHSKRRRWYANIGAPDPNGRATEIYAPEQIGERDEARAWEWFRLEQASQAAAVATVGPAELTADDVCELYLAWAEKRRDNGQLSAQHYTSKEYHLGLFADRLGRRTAATLTTEAMEEFIAAMQAVYSPNYVANICGSVSAAFNWAARGRKHLDANPIAGYVSPTVPRSPERFAERAEAAVWLRHLWRRTDKKAAAWPYERSAILMQRLLIRSGARPGELCCLRWSDLKWTGWVSSSGHECARATIPPERWKTGGKTGKPRMIYVPPVLTRALRREQAREGRHPTHVFIHGRGRGGQGAGQPWESGSRLSKKVLAMRRELIGVQEAIRARIAAGKSVKSWERATAAVTIQDEGENRLTNYRWRHTCASTLLMMGVDVPTVAELLGTSPEMIYRVYGHLLDKHLTEAAEKIHRRLSPRHPTPPQS